MKKQFNFYMDSKCKLMIHIIRQSDPNCVQGLSDSQIVERLIRKSAERYGYKDNDNFEYYTNLRVK